MKNEIKSWLIKKRVFENRPRLRETLILFLSTIAVLLATTIHSCQKNPEPSQAIPPATHIRK